MTQTGEHRRTPQWAKVTRILCGGALTLLAFLCAVFCGWLAALLLLSACIVTAVLMVVGE